MGKTDIIEGNKLIAEFMEYTIGNLQGWVSGNNFCSYKKENGEIVNPVKVENLKYHSSWDWLMPVVAKINYNSSIGIAMHYEIGKQYSTVLSYIKSLTQQPESK